MSRIMGIDPGKDGFACLIDDNDGTLAVVGEVKSFPTPTLKISAKGSRRDYDIPAMRRILLEARADLVVIEKQQAMPGFIKGGKRVKQGVSTSFATGRGFGLWEGLVAGMALRHIIVHPRTWQRICHCDVQGDSTKARSIIAAGRLFPGVDLRKNEKCRVSHDGKADALLLAWYGKHISFAEE